jgi:hypothetical protein
MDWFFKLKDEIYSLRNSHQVPNELYNRKYGASKLDFPHAKQLLPKSSAIWTPFFKMFCQPLPWPKILKISVSARQTISLPAAPSCLGPALGLVRNY